MMGKADREMVEKAISTVRLEELIDRPLDRLSDGERQRVMIARAFAQDAPLMILDEPTAFLDLPNRYELIQLLTRIRNAGKAVLYSTHDLESAMLFSDKLWVIHERKIREGVPEDLGIGGVFDSLFEATGISFDEEMRKFRPSVEVRGFVQLTGDDSRLIAWTRNALERLGYQLNEGAKLRLKVTASKGNYTWMLTWAEGSAVFENIETLARFLIQEN
jgi:iron complex transport system ATP-binding protein